MKVKVNVDDFGRQYPFSLVVPELAVSYSLMVTGKGFYPAVKLAKELKLDVGLHLDLTDNYLAFSLGIFFNEIKDEWIERHIRYQIERFLSTGLRLKRIDSHHGVHHIPEVFSILSGLMREYNIPYVRNPKRQIILDILRPKETIASWREWLYFQLNKKYMWGLKPYTENIAEFTGSVEILTH